VQWFTLIEDSRMIVRAEPEAVPSVGGRVRTPPVVAEVVKHPGKPLEPAVRQDFQHMLGHDFSAIQIHCDGEATRSTHALGARAWTLGRHVAVRPELLQPSDIAGRALLAHELTHAVQQAAFQDHHLAEAPVLDADHPSESEARTSVRTVTPLAAPAVQCERERSDLERITDAFPEGSLDEEGWRRQVQAAEDALARGDTQAATVAYKTLLLDAARLAGAWKISYMSDEIAVVSGTKDNATGVRPGLNLSIKSRDQWGANATTALVDHQGRSGVDLSDPGQPQPAVAIVVSRGAFFLDKRQTLGILRHELVHAEDNSRAATKAFLARPGTAPTRMRGEGANMELLGYLEGFMTMFQLAQPAPTAVDHPAFAQLLGAVDTGGGEMPWAEASDDIRSVALDRLEEYCRTVLEERHRDAFAAWVDVQLAAARRDMFFIGEDLAPELFPGSISDEILEPPKGHPMGAFIRRKARPAEFFRALRRIILRSKGHGVSMRLPAR
jgi:Domain of unknown function (DUF4157)